MTHDDWDQRLWELEYGLLPDAEAAALRHRIATDSELSHHYTRVREQITLVGKAARIEGSAIPVAAQREGSVVREVVRDVVREVARQGPAQGGGSARIRRVANWCLAMSATLLIGLGCWTGWQAAAPRSSNLAWRQEPAVDRSTSARSFLAADMSDESRSDKYTPVRLVVNTPTQLSGEGANPITVSTTSVNGSPRSAELDLRMESADGQEFFRKQVATDARGHARLDLPAIASVNDARLSIASTGDRLNLIEFTLPTAEPDYMTYLSTDKNRYRPGDVVRYRSVTLTRFGLKSDREAQVEYHFTSPNNDEVADSRNHGTTQHGVGNGEWPLGERVEEGRYSLVAHSPDGLFPDTIRNVHVQATAARRYTVAVDWSDSSFGSSSTATGSVQLNTADGQPAAGVLVNLRAFVDGRQVDVASSEGATDLAGRVPVAIPLPDRIAARYGDLGIEADEQDVEWKEVPLRPDQVQVEFFPEGGDLAANVASRVYFHSHDSNGIDAAVKGRIIDARNQVVCEVASEHGGRGMFRLTPEPGNAYFLQIDDPPSIQSRPPLPNIAAASRLVLDAGAAVWDPGRPIHVTLRAREAPARFVVAAYCRGVLVGQRAGSTSDFDSGTCVIDIPVIEETAGVVRLTVLDYSRPQPEPLAERLVYCRPLRQLQLHWSGLQAEYPIESRVRGELVATDEAGKPVTAVLGLAAVDASVLDADRMAVPGITAQLLLVDAIRDPEKLEDANFFVSTDPKAGRALDLLLATQGWRRFERLAAEQVATRLGQASEGLVRGPGAIPDGYARGMAGGMAGGLPGGMAGGMAGDSSPTPFALGKLAEIAALAPLQFDNLGDIASQREAHTEAKAEAMTPAETVLPVRLPPGNARVPIGQGGKSRMLLVATAWSALVVAAALILRWWPTRRVVIANAVGLATCAVLGIWLATAMDQSRFTTDQLATSTAGTEAAVAGGRAFLPAETEAFDGLGSSESLGSPSSRSAGAVESKSPRVPAAETLSAARGGAPALAPADAVEPPPAPATFAGPRPGAAPTPAATDPRAVEPAGAAPALPDRVDQQPLKRNASRSADASARELKLNQLRKSERAAIESLPLGNTDEKSVPDAASTRELRGAPRTATVPAPVAAPADKDRESVVAELNRPFFERRYQFVPQSRDRSGIVGGEFRDLVFWDPLVITDEHGRATIEFELPRTVTRFRVLAEGHSSGRLGEARHFLQTRPAN